MNILYHKQKYYFCFEVHWRFVWMLFCLLRLRNTCWVKFIQCWEGFFKYRQYRSPLLWCLSCVTTWADMQMMIPWTNLYWTGMTSTICRYTIVLICFSYKYYKYQYFSKEVYLFWSSCFVLTAPQLWQYPVRNAYNLPQMVGRRLQSTNIAVLVFVNLHQWSHKRYFSVK